MKETHQIDFDALSKVFFERFKRINRLKITVRCLTCVVYSMMLCWIVYCFYSTFFGWDVNYSQGSNTWIYFIVGFAAFYALLYFLNISLSDCTSRERSLMRVIILKMFPDAVFTSNKSIPRKVIAESCLFDVLDDNDKQLTHTEYGCIEFKDSNGGIAVYDMGVTSDKAAKMMSQIPVLGFIVIVYRSIILPIFGKPIESSIHSFRGMFGYHDSSLNPKGAVIILPDNLEDKIGYLAHGIQAFRKKDDARLVILEDLEFEKLFAVYADDEIEARKILTPAMMRCITKLRYMLGRELMISFNGSMVYCASETHNGFFCPNRKSLVNGQLLEQIYNDVNACRVILAELS